MDLIDLAIIYYQFYIHLANTPSGSKVKTV